MLARVILNPDSMGKGGKNGDGCCGEDCCPSGGGCLGCCTPAKDRLDINRPRTCQDLPAALLFVAFMIGTCIIAWWAVENGDARRLIYGEDSWGNTCGMANSQRIASVNSGLDLRDESHLYYTGSNDNRKLCLNECPQYTRTCFLNLDDCKNADVCIGSGSSAYAGIDNGEENAILQVLLGISSCPESVVESNALSVVNYCVPIPDIDSTFLSDFNDELNAIPDYNVMLEDIYRSREAIGICILGAIVASFLLIFLMRWFAKIIVYLTILLSMALFAGITGGLWYISVDYQMDLDDKPESEQTESETNNTYILWTLTAIATVMFLVYFCIICAMRKRIRQAILIFRHTSKSLVSMPSLFLCPAITNVVILCWVLVWLVVSLYIVTADDYEMQNTTGYIEYTDHEYINYIWIYMLLALFWGAEFVAACGSFTIASSFVMHYLSKGTKGGPHGVPMIRSIYRLFRYHFGSIAFGSLIIAIVQTVRVIVEYIRHKLTPKNSDSEIGKCAGYLMACLSCCLKCLEKCIRMINETAYVEIAIWGDGFCSSAVRGLHIMLDNLSLVAVVHGVGWLLATVMNLTVGLGAGVVAYLYLLDLVGDKEDIEYISVVIILIVVLCYLLSTMFTGLYSTGAEALMLCIIEDVKDGDGTDYMSKAEKQAWDVRTAEQKEHGKKTDRRSAFDVMEGIEEKETNI